MLCQQLQTQLKQLKTLYPELLTLGQKLDSVRQADRQIKESVYQGISQTQAQTEQVIQTIESIVYYSPIERAKKILGEGNVLGPEEVEKTFGIHLRRIPKIPFSIEELEQAQTLGQMLVLRVDRTNDGQPLSLQAMVDIIQPRWDREDKGRLLFTTNKYRDWQGMIGDDWRLKCPRPGWALVSKELLPKSTNKNYAQQTEIIIAYLKDTVFKDREIPQIYEEAFKEWEQVKKTDSNIQELLNHPDDPNYNPQETTKKLSELKINQLTRQSIPEVIYDLALYFDKNNQRLLPQNVYTWSNSRSHDGYLLSIGYFNSLGMRSSERAPSGCFSDRGILLSRRC